MEEIKANIWEFLASSENDVDAIAVTTNGFYSKGKATMGAGFAKQVRDAYPIVQTKLAVLLAMNKRYYKESDMDQDKVWEDEPWNIPYLLYDDTIHIFSFPTKRTYAYPERGKGNILFHYRDRVSYGGPAPGWMGRSDLTLIERSAILLTKLVDTCKLECVVLPRPGCGRGELSWPKKVKPLLEEHFDNRFLIVDQAK